MRFVISGEWGRNRLLAVIVWCFLAYTFILWLTNAGMYFAKMSLTPGSVVDYYLGNDARFLPPRSLLGLIEVLHFHSFAMGMLLMTLTHLMLFAPISMRIKAWGIATAFISGIAGELSGWGVRFIHPAFAYLKIASFLTLEGTLLCLIVLVAWALLLDTPNAYGAGHSPTKPVV